MLKIKGCFCNYLYISLIIFTFVASFLDQVMHGVILLLLMHFRKGNE